MTEQRPALTAEQKSNRRVIIGTLVVFAIPLVGFLGFIAAAAFTGA